MIGKDDISTLVGLFYRPTYKTFYINSTDGKEITKPTGVFVSLGITTSLKTMNNIKEFIESNKDYKARVVEIKSSKVGDQYINSVTDREPRQYKLEDLPEGIMSKEEVLKELELMKNKMSPAASLETITELSHKVHRLQYLVDRLDESNGWESHMIQRDGDSDYSIFHLYVNYEKDEGLEYRIGILVEEI